MTHSNPFEFDAAPNLDPRKLVEWYIEDHNYSRFIQSTRNVIINGERGSGKSMALIYHSLQYAKARSEVQAHTRFPGDHVGIYIPCNTPLNAKEEYKLLQEIPRVQLSEANLLNSIIINIAKELHFARDLFSMPENNILFTEFAYVLDVPIDDAKQHGDPFSFLRREARSFFLKQQKAFLREEWDVQTSLDSFFSVVVPILLAIRNTEAFENCHFSLLIDDLQDLNPYQRRLVNSWIGYRDHSVFSIKAAVAGLRSYQMDTNYGGVLLEGHDFVSIDLQRPVQNSQSEFGKFAYNVVRRRLANIGLEAKPEDFFPVSEKFVQRLGVAKRQTEEAAMRLGMLPGSKPFNDYVYKHRRVAYFRGRDPKANRPVYSGFDTITHLSTGVIRNLLQPCFWMFEQQTANLNGRMPKIIPSDIQDLVIKDQSDKLWEFLGSSLERRVSECSTEDAKRILRLFTRLSEYFRERLLHHASEPSVLVFMVSEKGNPAWPLVDRLLRITERAQLLYVRSGTAKKGGGRDAYYVPNRMLFPRYGLDVHGQHGRASIRAADLWGAAEFDVPIPLQRDDEPTDQRGLFQDG